MPATMNAVETANILGITTRQLDRLVADGTLPRVGRSKFDVAAVVQGFVRHREAVVLKATGGQGSYAQARTRKTLEEVARLEHEREIREGNFIATSVLERHWIKILAVFKSALLALPRKMAPQVTRLKSPEETEALLRREVSAILNRLSTAEWLPPVDRPA